MLKIVDLLNGKKTYIVAAVTFLYAVVIQGWQNHDWTMATQLILASGAVASLRNAVKKVQ